ncbi:helix-turn-helix domain-containing protein [Streptomyces sp. NPDC055051]
MVSEGELSSAVPSESDLERAKYAFAERLGSLRGQLGLSRRELAAKLNVKEASIVDYENLNPRRRTPVPGHTLVLRLVDEVKRSTRESDVSPVAIEDTLVMYRKLLELRVQVDRNSSYAKGVLEALESELRLRSNAEQLQAAKTALDTLRRLRRQGTAVPEETVQRQQREITRLEEEQPGLVTDVMRAEQRLALMPGAGPDPGLGPGPEAPAPPPPPSPPFRSRTPGRPVGVLGPVQGTPPASGRPPSWRYLIVGALVIILLGGFAIFRLTEDHSPTSNRADDEPQRTTTTPPPVRQTTTPAVTTTTAPAPKTTTSPPPTTRTPSPSPEPPERKVFVYQTARDVYVGYGRRSVDFDAKPPLQVGDENSTFDLETLESEGNAVILSRHYDRTQLVKTPAGFNPSYENCVALLVREVGQDNLPARAGDSFCLTTVKYRMVHFTVTEARPSSSNRETQVAVNATVWENPDTLDPDAG